MNPKLIAGVFALAKEIWKHPALQKNNFKKNRFKNILMLCFLIMFFGCVLMAEQAIVQSSQKYEAQVQLAALQKQIEQLERDLYVRHLSKGADSSNVSYEDDTEVSDAQ